MGGLIDDKEGPNIDTKEGRGRVFWPIIRHSMEGSKWFCCFVIVSDVNLHIKDIEKAISNLEAEQTYQLLKKQFERFSDNPESINLQEVWKVLKKVCPKQVSTVPMAKKNHKGDLVTNCNELKKLLAKEYKQRLRNRHKRFEKKKKRNI